MSNCIEVLAADDGLNATKLRAAALKLVVETFIKFSTKKGSSYCHLNLSWK